MTGKRKPAIHSMQLQSGQTDGGEDPDGCVKSDDVKNDIDGEDKELAGVEKKEEDIERFYYNIASVSCYCINGLVLILMKTMYYYCYQIYPGFGRIQNPLLLQLPLK